MPRGDPRLAPLPIRLTVAEKAQLTELAEARDESLSDAARHAILSTYNFDRNEARRRHQSKTVSRLGELLAELRRFGGLYALEAKTNRPVAIKSQALLDDAIEATKQVMLDLVS